MIKVGINKLLLFTALALVTSRVTAAEAPNSVSNDPSMWWWNAAVQDGKGFIGYAEQEWKNLPLPLQILTATAVIIYTTPNYLTNKLLKYLAKISSPPAFIKETINLFKDILRMVLPTTLSAIIWTFMLAAGESYITATSTSIVGILSAYCTLKLTKNTVYINAFTLIGILLWLGVLYKLKAYKQQEKYEEIAAAIISKIKHPTENANLVPIITQSANTNNYDIYQSFENFVNENKSILTILLIMILLFILLFGGSDDGERWMDEKKKQLSDKLKKAIKVGDGSKGKTITINL